MAAWAVPPAPVAAAGGSVTVSPDPVPVPAGGQVPVTVSWTGQAPRTLILIRICVTSSRAPGFDEALDCSLLSEVTPNGTPDGSGSAQVQVFRGPEPGGDNAWGCFAPGDAVPAGVIGSTTCYVRVTNNVVSNNDDAAEAAFTLAPVADGVPAPAGAGGGAGAVVSGAAVGAASDPTRISFAG